MNVKISSSVASRKIFHHNLIYVVWLRSLPGEADYSAPTSWLLSNPGNTKLMVNLLIKLACFVKKEIILALVRAI
jgi:hypothetical protein